MQGDDLLYYEPAVVQRFTTYDQDNDAGSRNCAEVSQGGWWYGNCHSANLNGLYLYGQADQPYAVGLVWNSFRGHSFSLKKSEMKLRPTS